MHSLSLLLLLEEAAAAVTASMLMLALLNLTKDHSNKICSRRHQLSPPHHPFSSFSTPSLHKGCAALLLTLSASSHNKAPISNSDPNPIPLLFHLLKHGSLSLPPLYPAPKPTLSPPSPPRPPSSLPHHILPRKSSIISEKACALLDSLVTFHHDARTALAGENGGILAVVQLIEEGSVLSKEHAVGTLLAMCQSDRDKYRVLFSWKGSSLICCNSQCTACPIPEPRHASFCNS